MTRLQEVEKLLDNNLQLITEWVDLQRMQVERTPRI
jgi:hypothetical protein